MTTFRTDRAPILPPIPQDATPDQQRFFKAVQDLLSENFRSTRQDLEAVDSTVSGLISYKQKKTYNTKYGFWGDVWYKDADEIIIKPVGINGVTPWISGVFSDGTYIESATAITAKLAVPGSSGHIGDGITAVLNSALYKLWLWNNAGTITPMFTYAPLTTFSNANPTNALTLGQINAQDIGKLFPVGSHVVVWQDTDEFETPYFFSQDGGATTVDVTADKPKVASTTTTVLTLGAALTNATFTAGSTVYQVDGWQPLKIDGTLATGTSGYLDTGIYILTDASGNIWPFSIVGDKFLFSGSNWNYLQGVEAVGATGGGWGNIRFASIPPDKCGIIMCSMGNLSYNYELYVKFYWEANGSCIVQTTQAHGMQLCEETRIKHQIFSQQYGTAQPTLSSRGYII